MGRDLSPTRRRGRSDIAALIAALGGNSVVVAYYDFRMNVSSTGGLVDALADARASGGGPTLTATGSARPTLSAAGITFDGVGTFLRNAVAGRLSEITQSCGLCVVHTPPPTGAGGNEWIAVLSAGATPSALEFIRNVSNGPLREVTASILTPALVGVQPTHLRRTGTGSPTFGIKAGSVAEVTATPAKADVTPTRLTLGGSSADAPSSFSDVIVKAIIVFKGDYAGKQALVNAWAASVHGAVLT